MSSEKPQVPASELRPGDLLLHASTGEISKLIQWASDSDYSHIAMVFAPGLIAEARSAGVLFAERIEARVQGLGTAFHFIDVMRPKTPNPLPEPVLQALQESAQAMKDADFALNQMLQLGLICALRNKMPGGSLAQGLVARILDRLVRQDPSKLVCSEFIYLAYAQAQTQPPGLLKPVITRAPLPNRPWPSDFNLWGLLQEYQDAKEAPTDAVVEEVTALAAMAAFEKSAAAFDSLALQARVLSARGATLLHAAKATAAQVNPELTLPQDFRDSPSFEFIGTLVA